MSSLYWLIKKSYESNTKRRENTSESQLLLFFINLRFERKCANASRFNVRCYSVLRLHRQALHKREDLCAGECIRLKLPNNQNYFNAHRIAPESAWKHWVSLNFELFEQIDNFMLNQLRRINLGQQLTRRFKFVTEDLLKATLVQRATWRFFQSLNVRYAELTCATVSTILSCSLKIPRRLSANLR